MDWVEIRGNTLVFREIMCEKVIWVVWEATKVIQYREFGHFAADFSRDMRGIQKF